MAKILPAFALGFGTLAIVSRLMRTSMLDVLNQDYIKTAKAKGLSNKKIIWRHAVRNAIMPIVTVMGAGCCDSDGCSRCGKAVFHPRHGQILCYQHQQ